MNISPSFFFVMHTFLEMVSCKNASEKNQIKRGRSQAIFYSIFFLNQMSNFVCDPVRVDRRK